MNKLTIALIFTTTILSTAVNAKPYNMRAGLWELRTSSDLLRLVPHIPADQMKNMEALAKEYGLEMPEIENGAAVTRTCITQEMAAQNTLPKFHQEALGCTSNKATRDGNRYKVNFTCDSAELKGDGSADGLITSPQSFSGSTQFKGQAQGASINEKADIAGKWVGASCGNVKPL